MNHRPGWLICRCNSVWSRYPNLDSIRAYESNLDEENVNTEAKVQLNQCSSAGVCPNLDSIGPFRRMTLPILAAPQPASPKTLAPSLLTPFLHLLPGL